MKPRAEVTPMFTQHTLIGKMVGGEIYINEYILKNPENI